MIFIMTGSPRGGLFRSLGDWPVMPRSATAMAAGILVMRACLRSSVPVAAITILPVCSIEIKKRNGTK